MDPRERWTPRDLPLGALFLAVGLGVILYAFLASRNGAPAALRSLAWVLGALLALLGANAVCRSLWAFRHATRGSSAETSDDARQK
jgi:hypothetical protein